MSSQDMAPRAPRLSVIVPVFDNEDRLKACLESIRSQSYRDFEAIVVDDGSTDRSGAIASAFCAKDERFSFVSQENGGVSAARNAGLERARGSYVTFVDADDLVCEDGFKRMHQATVVYDADTVCGIYRRVDGITPYRNGRSYNLANKTRRIAPDDPDLVHSWSLCNKWLSLDIIRRENLRFEPLRHLEDAVFLYSYLRHAKTIYACPHLVYTYRKPLPIQGRTTTQGASPELLEDAERALARLKELTSGYGPGFAVELDYRFLNAPLIGDYYHRLWTTDDAFAAVLAKRLDEQLARLDAGHRKRALAVHFDVLSENGARSKAELAEHPLVSVVVEGGVTGRVLRPLLEGLYDQDELSFEALVAEDLRAQTPGEFAAMPNLSFFRGDENSALAQAKGAFVAFLDCEVIYDHRSLSTMAKALKRNPRLSCVSLAVSTLEVASAKLPAGSLANRLFRADALRAGVSAGDVREAAGNMKPRRLRKPVVISMRRKGAEGANSEATSLEAASAKAPAAKAAPTLLQRIKRLLGGGAKAGSNGGRTTGQPSGVADTAGSAGTPAAPAAPAPATPAAKKRVPTSEFYLNLEVDPDLVVVEALGKQPRGSSLYILQELQKPEYGHPRIVFPTTEGTRAAAEALFEERGIEGVTCVVAGSDGYKRALFSARVLFNEVDFPNWWIKKPHQVYVNIWHGTPLKKLGRAKGGIVHRDANASRNFTMADYVLCANDYSIEHILGDCDVLGLTRAKALMLGYPRTGELFDAAMRDRVRERCGLAGEQAIAWMPTYREYLDGETANAFLRDIDGRLSDGQVLYVNLHHKTAAQVSYEGLAHVRPFPDGLDTYEFLCGVDVLVTDYSSIMFDFAVTRRKIVLYCPDAEEYERERGLYRSVGDLPFPVARDAGELAAELARGTERGYDDTAFVSEFCAHDSAGNAASLCRLALLGDESGVELRALGARAVRPTFIVSDGLEPGPATDLLYALADDGAFGDGVYLSFLEHEVDKNEQSAYPLVERVPLYATKGKPVTEVSEQMRLYGDLDPRAVVVLDTPSARRVRCFTHFDVPTYLFVQPELARAAEDDPKTRKALRSFARWGDGLFAMDEDIAAEVRELTGAEVEVIATPAAFEGRFL